MEDVSKSTLETLDALNEFSQVSGEVYDEEEVNSIVDLLTPAEKKFDKDFADAERQKLLNAGSPRKWPDNLFTH